MKAAIAGERLGDLLRTVQAYHPNLDTALLERAFEFACQAHAEQSRADGEAFITHPLEVARILAEMEVDQVTLAAALLHDVAEDTPVTLEEISAAFGSQVAEVVEGVTKLGRIEFHSQRERQAENLRRMLLAMARDMRVILVKLADRLHNLRTLGSLTAEKRQEIARETLQIFAPIAHRLGIWRLKWELEDISLRHLEPETYRKIVRLVNRSRKERVAMVEAAVEQLRARLQEIGIKAEVSGRPKHFYSIYMKMQSQQMDFDQILDLEAIRVIVDTIPDCYAVLGEVHHLWMPLPDMFTDYIAKPKPNLYQGLHTKIWGPHGGPMEVQIRTWEMHRTAEYGIAAHWRYKEGAPADRDFDRKLSWLRQLIELQSELKDPGEWLESLKVDLFKDQVFVFTPRGDVIDLSAGATPVDFAYRIHTDIGNHCVGARVNGKLVQLSYQFRNGDVVEIMTKASTTPSLDWLNLVVTPQARSRIKSWFRRLHRQENIQQGQRLLDQECRRLGLAAGEVLEPEKLAALAPKLNLNTVEDLLAAIGYGDVLAESVVNRLREEPRRLPQRPAKPSQGALQVGISAPGVDGMLFKLSRCCSPVPGDPVVGYVTRGKGVTVHRSVCPNLVAITRSEPERLLKVDWELSKQAFYPAEVKIEALDRMGLLGDLLAIVSSAKTNVRSARARTIKPRVAVINLVLDVNGLDHLHELIKGFSQLSDVLQVHRVRG